MVCRGPRSGLLPLVRLRSATATTGRPLSQITFRCDVTKALPGCTEEGTRPRCPGRGSSRRHARRLRSVGPSPEGCPPSPFATTGRGAVRTIDSTHNPGWTTLVDLARERARTHSGRVPSPSSRTASGRPQPDLRRARPPGAGHRRAPGPPAGAGCPGPPALPPGPRLRRRLPRLPLRRRRGGARLPAAAQPEPAAPAAVADDAAPASPSPTGPSGIGSILEQRRRRASGPSRGSSGGSRTATGPTTPTSGGPRSRVRTPSPSSSTPPAPPAEPKGVMVSHGNLLHNEEMIRRAFGQSEDSVVVGWLPLYHDMGLIGNVLQPLYVGARCVLMSPVAFLQRPRALARGDRPLPGDDQRRPELRLRPVRAQDAPEEPPEGLDLSPGGWPSTAPSRCGPETLERFAAAFAAGGFRPEAFYPCYGLAEATLFVTGGAARRSRRRCRRRADAGGAASSGPRGRAAAERRPREPGRLRPARGRARRCAIVDPESGRPLPTRAGSARSGSPGPSVAGGYWKRPERRERDLRRPRPRGRRRAVPAHRRPGLPPRRRAVRHRPAQGPDHPPRPQPLPPGPERTAEAPPGAAAGWAPPSPWRSAGEERLVVVARGGPAPAPRPGGGGRGRPASGRRGARGGGPRGRAAAPRAPCPRPPAARSAGGPAGPPISRAGSTSWHGTGPRRGSASGRSRGRSLWGWGRRPRPRAPGRARARRAPGGSRAGPPGTAGPRPGGGRGAPGRQPGGAPRLPGRDRSPGPPWRRPWGPRRTCPTSWRG